MTGAITLRTGEAAETRRLAAALADLLAPGDVVALSGELGAGKTCFVQGAAAGLAVTATVTSPTFVLVRNYQGRLPLVHVDVYRLQRLQDVLDLGDDVFAPDVVTFVEWGDAIVSLLPEDRLDVEIVHVDDVDDAGRCLTVTPRGAWEERMERLTDTVAPWQGDGAC